MPNAKVKFAGSRGAPDLYQTLSDDETASSARSNPSALGLPSQGKSFMENMTNSVNLGSFGTNNAQDEENVEEARAIKKMLKELRNAADRLEGPVQKFPRSGKGLFKKMQDRYVALIPGEAPSSHSSEEENMELALWRAGQLAYWDDAAAFKRGGPPKGFVAILKIAKVWVSKDDSRSRSVVVKHKRGDEMQELVLCFPTKSAAEEWSYKLWEFISKLRGHGGGSTVGM